MPFDSDWLWSLFGQGQQPTAGAAPPPPATGLSLNGYNPAIPGARLPVISDAVSAPPAAPTSSSSQGGGYPSQGDRYWWPQVAQSVWNAAKSGATLPGDVASGKATMEDPATQQRVGDMASLAMVGAGGAPAEPDALNMGIRAYHGSPYSFDRFDIGKIGEGEGAQVYGHGLYFAGNEDVAKSYRDSLSQGQWTYDGTLARESWPTSALEYLDKKVADQKGIPAAVDDAITRLKDQSKFYNQTYAAKGSTDPNIYDYAIQRLQHLDPAKIKPAGSMYQVDINAEPQHFLDWDKPFAEQSPVVQQAFTKANAPVYPDTPGKHLLGFLSPDAAKASAELRDAGIPGIKYLDQASRGAGTGTQNYVTFTDNIVKIMRKYGIGALGAAGAGDLTMSQMGQPKRSAAPQM